MTSCHVVLRACRAPDAILGHIFRFRWDLWVFTYVAWSMIDDYMSPDFRPVVHPMPILGHIFRFRWDLWIFTYVAWSMIDDFMSPDFRPVVHPMPYWGIFPFWVRFTDLRGGHVLDDRWFHDTCSLTCHTSDDILGRISVWDEIHGSSRRSRAWW